MHQRNLGFQNKRTEILKSLHDRKEGCTMVFFADRLYQLRCEKGYTQEELASLLGCMPRMIQDYEEGRLYPHAIAMTDLADLFDVSLDYLMGRTENRQINR